MFFLNLKLSLINLKLTLINLKLSLINLKLTLINLKLSLINLKLTLINLKLSLINLKLTLINLNLTLINLNLSLINLRVKRCSIPACAAKDSYSIPYLPYKEFASIVIILDLLRLLGSTFGSQRTLGLLKIKLYSKKWPKKLNIRDW